MSSADGKKQAEDKIKESLAKCCLGTALGHTTGPVNPPMSKACGICPPCPASCNPNAPPTVAEKELKKQTLRLTQTEENFKIKVTECALLRSELMKKKEELEKERCMHREVQNKLRTMELRFEGLKTSTNAMLGTKEQELENEISVRALKRSYRDARDEIDELRLLLKEQNEQLQDYRVKFLQATQLAEGQKKQIDLLELDNNRISEQINLEVQRVKLKFQEKLLELSPIPDLLKSTQMRLRDAQQSQALAEHNAEQLARELSCAREKMHVLLHAAAKPAEKQEVRGMDDKQVNMMQQRLAQLTDNNVTLKTEIERLKSNIVRVEENALSNARRLQEKMHECAQLGAELDRMRDEAARAITRVTERIDINRKCLQTTIAELERQLAAARGRLRSSEKEREEVRAITRVTERIDINRKCLQTTIAELERQLAAARGRLRSSEKEREEVRAITRVTERIDINRKCLQTTIAELERQLAAARGRLRSSEKEREEVRAITRVTERIDINRKCLQTTIAELERQLAAARGRLRSSEKEREEVRAITRVTERIDINRKCLQTTIAELERQLAAACGRLRSSEKEREEVRAITRVTERIDINRKCLQTTIAELERQLAAARGRLRSSEKEREEVRAITRVTERIEINRKCLQTTIAELERQLAEARGRLRSSEKEREEVRAITRVTERIDINRKCLTIAELERQLAAARGRLRSSEKEREEVRAITRVTERIDINRKCLQTTKAELERQLAAARGRLRSSEKEREEIQCRMTCQIKRLKENFEQAQLRIMSLSSQVVTLRRTPSDTDDKDKSAGGGECMCKTLFSNP